MTSTQDHTTGRSYGPDAKLLTPENLPSPQTMRWVMRRKAEIVTAVRGGLLSLEEACARYAISLEEFLGWESAMDRFGPVGLQATHARIARMALRRADRHRGQS